MRFIQASCQGTHLESAHLKLSSKVCSSLSRSCSQCTPGLTPSRARRATTRRTSWEGVQFLILSYLHLYLCLYLCPHLSPYLYTYVYLCICIYIYRFIHISIYTHIYMYTYIHLALSLSLSKFWSLLEQLLFLALVQYRQRL